MITYILIGIVFMFFIEQLTRLNKIKKYKKNYPKAFIEFGFWERMLGILFWPILLGVFLYNFIKSYLKL